MSEVTLTGLVLIVVPIAFNVAFGMLAAQFEYPDVLRQPTTEILAKFTAGGTRLILTWWGFALTALAMVPMVLLLAVAIGDADPTLLLVATTIGVLAGLVQTLGLLRWPFLVPFLARADAEGDPARRDAVDIVFQSFNRYLGVAVGEHLGYLLTGAWTLLIGVALTQTAQAPAILGWLGIVTGPVLMLCALEFVGANEREGSKLAEQVTPGAYVVWSLWLIATGVALIA